MAGTLQIEVLRSWEEAANLRTEWNELNKASGCGHPFTTYEWFDCWYPAYCKPENVAVIVARDGNYLRAILPGMIVRQKIGGIKYQVFTYAGNGHSPRCGIISKKNDIEAIRSVLFAIWNQLKRDIHLAILMNIDIGSPTQQTLATTQLPHLPLHIEHQFNSPAFDISNGWETYLLTRSKHFRKKIHKTRNRADQLGGTKHDIISPEAISEKIIERLKSLDSKTWQHLNRTGLFSTSENECFYYKLLKSYAIPMKITVCFLQIRNVDAAYELAAFYEGTAFFLKSGYDPKFRYCSPGFLLQLHLCKYISLLGFKEVDLLGEITEEKVEWSTHSREHKNYWIINRKSIWGRILYRKLLTYRFLKKVIGKEKENKSNIERVGNTGNLSDEEI